MKQTQAKNFVVYIKKKNNCYLNEEFIALCPF